MNDSPRIRLNKILRELNISLDEAKEYLEIQGHNIEPRTTTKVNDEIYKILSDRFGAIPDKEKSINNPANQIVVAVRGNKAHDNLGYPKPVGVFENEYITRNLNKEERESIFKNTGYIIVKSNFYQVWENFEPTEFFTIGFEEDKSYIENSSSSIKYMSTNGNSESARKLPLLVSANISQILQDKIIDLPYAGHRFVYIKENNKVYGPISIQQNIENAPIDIYSTPEFYEYSIQPLPVNFFGLDRNYENVIFIYNNEDIQNYLIYNRYGKNDVSEFYITNPKHLLKNLKYDSFILNESDEDVIDLVNKLLPESYKDKSQWISPDAAENPITKSRFERYLKLQDKSEKWLEFIENYISEVFLKSDEGNQEIQKYLEKNEESFLQEFRAQIKDKIYLELQEESNKLETAQIEREKLEAKIETLKNEELLIKSKSNKLLKLEEQIETALEKLDLINNLKDLRDEEEKQDIRLVDAIKKVEKYEEQLKQLKDQYSKESEAAMHKKLLDLKPYVDALNGFNPTTREESTISPMILPPLYEDDSITLADLVTNTNQFLKNNHRSIKQEDIVNHLTCIQQGFLTIFSGLPGVGKTSLALLYSKFLTAGKTFIDIPVSRGWNSKKNLLGFFNPISGVYQNDEYGFSQLISLYNNGEIPMDIPAIVLLDESNLSPMEHYWSDFISISDRHSNARYIANPDSKGSKLKLPKGLRFIATINNDHTTEMLSPRLIDRSAVIKISYSKPTDDYLDFNNTNEIIEPQKIYRQESLEKIFNSNNPEFNRHEQKIVSDIINILSDEKSDFGVPTPLSPRKLKHILKYCSTTRDIYFDMSGNQILNLDYAILQHVLPSIAGQGVKYENRLEALKKTLEDKNLMKSAKEMSNIISKGQDYKVFTFF